ncbi:hypothetical protein [Sandaracinus amylolyticus]|uniref:hypothetical protein n=1 Tax=Sandaracinus amylolyticus TaxID=927083 RepID=UPI001F39733E|nr:hypothetical protein [Sandaracinus amylolyticus]UJR87158.1 Hypothetical protein I5071_92590 [Sandaracinus amylolyticus]
MITVLLVALALVGLLAAAYGAVRFEQHRRLRDERTRWEDLALLLDAELRVGEDGRLSLHGEQDDATWILRASGSELADDTASARALLEVTFDAADRLAPAIVWREPPEDAGELERVGTEEFRTVFEVEQGSVPAGCVRWIEDREIQDLLLASGAFAAMVRAQDPRRPTIAMVLDQVDLDAVRLAIEWASRMSRIAREGIAATPPH